MPSKPEAKPEEKKPPNPTINLCFYGYCECKTETKRGKKKKVVGAMFYVVSDEDWAQRKITTENPEERLYTLDIVRRVRQAGTVWKFEYPEGKPTSIFTNSMSYLGRLENDDRLMQWQAEAEAFMLDRQRAAKEKDDKSKSEIRRACEPLKRTYNRLVARHRVVFMAQVISYITSTGKIPEESDEEE